MKRTILAVVIATLSASSFAGSFDNAVSTRDAAKAAANQASFNHAVANANYSHSGSPSDAMTAARAEADKHTAANAYQSRDRAVSGSAMKAQAQQQQAQAIAADAAATAARQTALADANAKAAAKNAAARSIAAYGVKGNPNLTSQYTPDPQKVSYNGVSQRPGAVSTDQSVNTPSYTATTPAKPGETESMNFSAKDVKPDTKVTATINGVTTTTTAGEVAKVDPTAQISVPHAPALIVSQRQGSDHSKGNTRSEHGTGNGGNNAANSNSAHGLGGGNHIGGGSAQSGSRNVGHW
ncbi:hypothetical protein G4E03_003475 [Salmonella enterica]|nr:hypothetical protein [Salmonella enterica]